MQGDPLSMALFCIAIRAPVKWVASAANAVVSSGELGPWAEPVPPVQVQERVQSWVEEARALAPPRDLEGSHESVSVQPRFYADDGVWRVPRWLLARMPALIGLCFAVPRLAMKQEKWEAFAPEGPQGPLRQEELGPESVVRVAEGGMVVAGAPLEDVSAMPAAAVVVVGSAPSKMTSAPPSISCLDASFSATCLALISADACFAIACSLA